MAENYNKVLTPELKEKLRPLKHLALDMDGTIYLGSNLFPFTIGFLDSMEKAGVGHSFLTNNPTKSVAAKAARVSASRLSASPLAQSAASALLSR